MKPMHFQAYNCPDCQFDMVTLRDFKPLLITLDTRELFQTAMVNSNLPGIQGMESCLLKGHIQETGRLVFSVVVCADGPKDLDPVITFEVNHTSLLRNENIADPTATALVMIDFPIALELRQAMPLQAAQQFPIGQATLPTIETINSGTNPRSLAYSIMRWK